MRSPAPLAVLALAATTTAAPTFHEHYAAGPREVNRPTVHANGTQTRDGDCGWLRESCLSSCEDKADYWKFICRDVCNTFVPC
ncbi:hypothetical protein GGTG_04568 [Gaeumannomyces tritici R3-111a-1]|uniref:ShKT domain-containing protein n=1 Tax=Gaeumannomyces tritici (strain R3-111a-1) TaxID=644352 RepID=J3NTG9_GAET3|nr:hypothetical protein GGTG_04568 [Gaeumannomyces tritici R3-111a-1]EJT79484.1 hypothetical protein GGTG_04568 [Gaeumannomyces tritici R3-111a-1]